MAGAFVGGLSSTWPGRLTTSSGFGARHGLGPVVRASVSDNSGNDQKIPECSVQNWCCKHLTNAKSLVVATGYVLHAEIAYAKPPVVRVFTDEQWQVILTTDAILAFLYLIVFPLVIFFYLRARWFKRNKYEAFFQFLLVFIFFPGMLLCAPFLNFRKLPKDPNRKNPWDYDY